MRISFLLTVTLCLLLLAAGIVCDETAGCGFVSDTIQRVGIMLAEPDPRPESEKDIFTRILNGIAMLQHWKDMSR